MPAPSKRETPSPVQNHKKPRESCLMRETVSHSKRILSQCQHRSQTLSNLTLALSWQERGYTHYLANGLLGAAEEICAGGFFGFQPGGASVEIDLDISHDPPGIYLLQYQDERGVRWSQKLVIEWRPETTKQTGQNRKAIQVG